MLLMCDFQGFVPPEMVKVRPVVVICRGRGSTLSVVPLSTIEPTPLEAWHYEMPVSSLPRSLRAERSWAKCDMLTCVGRWRLDRIRDFKCPQTGKRLYVAPTLPATDLEQIRAAIRHALQL